MPFVNSTAVVAFETEETMLYLEIRHLIIHDSKLHLITLYSSCPIFHHHRPPLQSISPADRQAMPAVRSNSGLPMGNQRRSALRRAELRRHGDPVKG